MKKNYYKGKLFLIATIGLMATGSMSIAQEGVVNSHPVNVSSTAWNSFKTIEGIDIFMNEVVQFEGSKLLSVKFVNSTLGTIKFSWIIEDQRGVKSFGKEIELSTGQSTESMNVMELKGGQNASNCIVTLKIN